MRYSRRQRTSSFRCAVFDLSCSSGSSLQQLHLLFRLLKKDYFLLETILAHDQLPPHLMMKVLQELASVKARINDWDLQCFQSQASFAFSYSTYTNKRVHLCFQVHQTVNVVLDCDAATTIVLSSSNSLHSHLRLILQSVDHRNHTLHLDTRHWILDSIGDATARNVNCDCSDNLLDSSNHLRL